MASATLASPYIHPQASFNLYQSRSTSSSIIPRDESGFASYLQVVKDNLQQVPAAELTSSHEVRDIQRPKSLRIRLPRKRNDDDGEIDIFAADKYFSGGVVDANDHSTVISQETRPSPLIKIEPAAKGATTALPKSRSLTWTVTGSSCGSETSGNSQTALLRDRRTKRPAPLKQAVAAATISSSSNNSRLFCLGGSFWCSSCSRKSSVKIDKSSADASSSQGTTVGHLYERNQSWSPASWRIEMASPGPWPWPGSSSTTETSISKSISCGGASLIIRQSKAPAAQMLINSSLRRNAAAMCKEEDDLGSESSSDLFEIESLTLNRAEGAAYEPSEASIDWSVVTASAANVSVASDRSSELVNVGKKLKVKGPGVSSPRLSKTTGMLLAGCASHKAVQVSSGEAAPDSRKLQVGMATAAEAGRSISPVVARYHVELEPGVGSGRAVVGRSTRTSWGVALQQPLASQRALITCSNVD